MPNKPIIALLLEDEPLTALDIEQTLGEAGFDVSTVATCAEAFDWLAMFRPNLVIVDIILRDGPCHAVVEQLVADSIPFMVHSGDHPAVHAETVLSKGIWIGKPSDRAEMIQAARGLVLDIW